MYSNPDWDPLQTLNDLAENLEQSTELTVMLTTEISRITHQIKKQDQALEHLVRCYNHLNQKLKNLEDNS